MFSFNFFISRLFSRLSCLYSWNFLLIKLTDSYRSVGSVVPLIWFSCVVCAISLRIFISFSKFWKQLNRMLANSGDFNPSAKTSVFSETDESFKLLSRCFLLDSPLSSQFRLNLSFGFWKNSLYLDSYWIRWQRYYYNFSITNDISKNLITSIWYFLSTKKRDWSQRCH